MRLTIGAALFAVVAVAGCTKTVEEMNYSERQALAKQIVDRCLKQGLKLNTPDMKRCTDTEIQSEIYSRRREAAVEDARRGSATVCNRVGYAVICG
ncbi:hypothetical protein [Mesorhizobium retamae]|uniref:Lipoprotein n=1 Tax=Mesorhizobium retamae TaxID=2912854 RepID=A0ABS9QN84_9HYPH|nr:hypothetical protein [Mesorhizobium sp. IRAMC:0171]MCG7508862.1 hypothetical protein [Mesorhizobium sp. IRAMC:0171]